MASSQEFVEYVKQQLCSAGNISIRKMFGEYGIYFNSKFIGVICENQFFLKPTEKGRDCLNEVKEIPPYEGASPYFLIEELENQNFLAKLMTATWDALPEPKRKRKKQEEKEIFLS